MPAADVPRSREGRTWIASYNPSRDDDHFSMRESALPRDQHRPSGAAVALALLALYVIWGSTYLAIRIGLLGFPPLLLAGIRFVVAGTVLYGFTRWRGSPPPTRAEWLGAAAIGCLLLGGGNGGVTVAEQWVPSGLAALAVATVPMWTALFGGFWGRWPTRLEWAGLALGLAGVGLLSLEHGIRFNPVGGAILLAAAMSWGFGSAFSNRLTQPRGLMGSAAQMLGGGAALLAAAALSGQRIVHPPGAAAIAALVYLTVFGSLVAFSAFGFLLRNVRPALATSYAYVNPAVAVALGVGLGGETITGYGLLALVVILAGVALVMLGHRPRTHEQPTGEGPLEEI